jgi:hypothetical protein
MKADEPGSAGDQNGFAHGSVLMHDQEKWKPVFRKDHAPPKCKSEIVST